MRVWEFGVNQSLVEELYLRYKENPHALDANWRGFFDALEKGEPYEPPSNGSRRPPAPSLETGNGQVQSPPITTQAATFAATQIQNRVDALINAYRTRGHLKAKLDPLALDQNHTHLFSLQQFGLDQGHLEEEFATDLPGRPRLKLKQIIERLEAIYCSAIGVELDGIEDTAMRRWLLERVEQLETHYPISTELNTRVLTMLCKAESFEQFIHTNYVGSKRFSLEGGESAIPFLDQAIERAGEKGVEEVIIGMAHRGRLNVLANILNKKPKEIFLGFEDPSPEQLMGRGDVKYHLGYSSDRKVRGGKKVHLSLSFNPSHLEFVNPVVEGRVRAKQDRHSDRKRGRVLPLLIHGDAAFIGQGVVAETLNLTALEGYATGGTLHLVINNQLGFTTDTKDARSTRYATDLVRMLRCPVFHINGENLEAVVRIAQLASEFRQEFGTDVVVDLYCYRRYGHNEADEPRFTQPVMYAAVDSRPGVRELYAQQLIAQKVIQENDVAAMLEKIRGDLASALEEARAEKGPPPEFTLQGVWEKYVGGDDQGVPDADTSYARDKLVALMKKLCQFPSSFHVHPKVKRLMDDRLSRVEQDKPLDWGIAENLAYASLAEEGANIRISGQDTRRGTFSHRHAALFDTQSGDVYVPAQHLGAKQGRFEIYDSPLSEAGVLGFEYGYSLDSPDALVVWEAQFGDFGNGGQVIIDQFLTSSEDKWRRLSGLTLLLPHAFEGQGPEHSSARLERFLAACAEDNIQVCNLTTPAQIFHCLRRQVLRPFRKPLIIMSPKSLLRHPKATSSVDDLARGKFSRIMVDAKVTQNASRVLLCSGKVYYDLLAERDKRQSEDVAIIRLEQLYPLHANELLSVLEPYRKNNPRLIWVQEEPYNMGAWYFMSAYGSQLIKDRWTIECVSRNAGASPATGSMGAHLLEQKKLLTEAFEN